MLAARVHGDHLQTAAIFDESMRVLSLVTDANDYAGPGTGYQPTPARQAEIDAIRQARGVDDLRVDQRRFASDELLVKGPADVATDPRDVVIGVSPGAAVAQGHAEADAVEEAVQRALPESDVVVHVEPEASEAAVREQAQAAAQGAPVPIEVVNAVADELPYDDGSFDVGVACLVLCTVPDQDRALAELHRIIRPGGALHFYEHVHAHGQPLRGVLEVLDRSRLWPLIAGGCHPTRETADAIRRAGFEIEQCRRFPFSAAAFMPAVPHIIGRATRR
jgi:SAM-dependent methyltransferase